MSYLKSLRNKINDYWIKNFVNVPDKLRALKITLSIAALFIPVSILGDAFIATMLALGVVATSLAETDVHPRGRLKSLLSSVILLPVLSLCVELTLDVPWLFVVGIGVTTFWLTLLGGRDARFQGVTFGGLLIITYTMLGAGGGQPFYYQPVFFFLGGALYSAVSLILLYQKPWRILQEQVAFGYEKLAEYFNYKSKLFPSLPEQQAEIRNELALLNIEVFQQIEQIKRDLYSFTNESSAESMHRIDVFYQKWYVLQKLHERAISSHDQYDVLSKEVPSKELIQGLGQMMKEIARALNSYAQSLLSGEAYQHPISLDWTASAMRDLIKHHSKESENKALNLLFKNLNEINYILKHIEDFPIEEQQRAVNQKITIEKPSIKQLLNPSNSRFRFAVRISLCFVVGYGIMSLFHMDKGAWILLTSLIVCQQTYNATRQRILYRVLGTFLGVVAGVLIARLIPTVEGQVVVLLLSIYLFNYYLKKNYTVAVIFITIFVLEAFNIQYSKGALVLAPRLIDTLIGSLLAYCAARFLWPDWQYKQLNAILKNALLKNRRYFESVYDSEINNAAYLHNQRSAHRADNTLTNAWKGMKLEPKSKQKMIATARNLTYLNHTLLSYISAFGVHKTKNFVSPEELQYCIRVSETLDQILSLWENPEEDYTQELAQCSELVDELQLLRNTTTHKNYIFIYNVARISKELFYESLDLLKVEYMA
uniref:FUSC family membrane protein n=1 Tax=Ornithobacterium rhinotracheale TaxID=28251 RepID=UPI0039A4CEFC